MRKILVFICFLCVSTQMWSQKVSLGMNALDVVNLGTLNAEMSFALSQHWSVNVQGRFNNWSFGSMEKETLIQNKSRGVALGGRYWLWNIYSGWWVGANARWDEYNRGGWFGKVETEEGDAFGGGLSGGYAYMLTKHWNIDFGVGMWGGRSRYVVYDCQKCGRKIDSGWKSFVLVSPNSQISLVYVF